jgi:hypothetical protein
MGIPATEKDKATDLLLEKINGLDRLTDSRFKAGESAVMAALAATKELTAAAFAASKEAIIKAEEAQKAYNVSHNDLIRKQEMMIPRPEFDRVTTDWRDKFDNLKEEIADLRESRSQQQGGAVVQQKSQTQSNWIIGLLVVAGLQLVGMFIEIAILIFRGK